MKRFSFERLESTREFFRRDSVAGFLAQKQARRQCRNQNDLCMWKIENLSFDGFKALKNFEPVYQRTENTLLIGRQIGRQVNHLMDVITRQKLSAIPERFSSGKTTIYRNKTSRNCRNLASVVNSKNQPCLKSKTVFEQF